MKKPVVSQTLEVNTMDEVTKKRILKEKANVMTHYAQAPEKFLAAWKKAVRKIGIDYFQCDVNDIEDATDKNQLRPNYELFERRMGTASPGEAVFMASVYTFFNGDDGQKLLDEYCPDYRSVGDIAHRLELDELDIITQLMLNHTGW